MYTKKQSNKKTFFTVITVMLSLFCILIRFAVVLLIIYIVFPPVDLDEETQAQLNRDTEHAAEYAITYLDEKYHMDYELNTFKPRISWYTSDSTWKRTHYNSEWLGNFTVDGKKYGIDSFIDKNEFRDNYQASQIFSAYEELIMQYFPDTYEENGTIYDVEYEIEFWGLRFTPGYFSTYYDGTNLGELLLENGIYIDINIDDDVSMSDEFWLECEEALANMEKDYEGARFMIIKSGGAPREDSAYGRWKRTHN